MATTTNYSWTTPDDTALVKDGASAIRTLGSSVDTTVKNLNPETTLGDLAYRSSTANVKTRLALGTAGQVLAVNSGATAPEWITASGYNPNYALLNAGGTALSGSSTTVSGISGIKDIFIRVDLASGTANPTLQIRFNSDSGSNYYIVSDLVNSVNAQAQIAAYGSTAGDNHVIYCLLNGTNTTGVKPFWVAGFGAGGNGNKWGNGFYSGASAITSVSVLCSSGTFDNGTLFVYGA